MRRRARRGVAGRRRACRSASCGKETQSQMGSEGNQVDACPGASRSTRPPWHTPHRRYSPGERSTAMGRGPSEWRAGSSWGGTASGVTEVIAAATSSIQTCGRRGGAPLGASREQGGMRPCGQMRACRRTPGEPTVAPRVCTPEDAGRQGSTGSTVCAGSPAGKPAGSRLVTTLTCGCTARRSVVAKRGS